MNLEERHELVGKLFAAACELPADEREGFLARSCAPDSSVMTEVLELLRQDRDPSGPIPRVDDQPADELAWTLLLDRLASRRPERPRYQLLHEIGRGGMGAVFKVWDADLRRHLALKRILCRPDPESGQTADVVDSRSLGRFLEEAQITGQLDHPGIVPVHELGIDDDGHVFFTMRLVKGRDLREIFELVRAGAEGWNLTRALTVLLRVCEAMAFAHDRGVIHRDLKPANIMVGRFGETYVMDWGLGRVLDQEDESDDDRRVESAASVTDVRTYRADEHDSPDALLVTLPGDVVGTPSYMSPEQARGDVRRMGRQTDVYAIGAILYELLAGKPPYHVPEMRAPARVVWRWVIDGPPRPIAREARGAPAELVAICEKAMARQVEHRYADVGELADELRAFLENRVVRAHRTGPVAEFQKWVGRNRATATALAALVLSVSSAGFLMAEQARRQNEVTARALEQERVADLVATAPDQWPADAAALQGLRRWRQEATAAVAHLPEYRRELAAFERGDAAGVHAAATAGASRDDFSLSNLERLRADMAALLDKYRGQLGTGPQIVLGQPLTEHIALLEARVGRLDQQIAATRVRAPFRPTWTPADEIEREHLRLASLVHDLDVLAEPEHGWIATVARRAVVADMPPSYDAEWRRAIDDMARSPVYDEPITAQWGLMPLERDPDSGLWEFWHVLSGARPERAESGRWRIDESTGIVLVLVPGGTFRMGAQGRVAEDHNYVEVEGDPFLDPRLDAVTREERPVHEVTLAPYFLSKYELTQGQWFRATGDNPSRWAAGMSFAGDNRISAAHPVESVTWGACERVLGAWGLTIPTEAQWERAARAGTESAYTHGRTFATLADSVNFADVSGGRIGIERTTAREIDDGYSHHAPVDRFAPSLWGFHGMAGNVLEWCRDWYCQDYDPAHLERILPGDGEHVPPRSRRKSTRGGSFYGRPRHLRVSSRSGRAPGTLLDQLGVRACRPLDS